MTKPYALIDWSRRDDTLIVGFRYPRMDEGQITGIMSELLDVAKDSGCRKYVLRFGPRPVECLYSVFLAKLITLQRMLAADGLGLVLCEMHPSVRTVFQACKLENYFLITGTLEEALNLALPDPLPGRLAPPCTQHRCGGPFPSEEKK
jgi:anti-anti-sigma regulatory factor